MGKPSSIRTAKAKSKIIGNNTIIAMSANTHKKDIEIALKAGMSTHIGKPFDVKELYKVISLELIKE